MNKGGLGPSGMVKKVVIGVYLVFHISRKIADLATFQYISAIFTTKMDRRHGYMCV